MELIDGLHGVLEHGIQSWEEKVMESMMASLERRTASLRAEFERILEENTRALVAENERQAQEIKILLAGAQAKDELIARLNNKSAGMIVKANPNQMYPSVIRQIGHESGLPPFYCATFGINDVGHCHNATIRVSNQTKSAAEFEWYSISKNLTDEMEALPWEQVLSEGMLVRHAQGHTALLPIAQAAVVYLNNLAELLECVVWAIDCSMKAAEIGEPEALYDLFWQPEKSWIDACLTFAYAPKSQWLVGIKGSPLARDMVIILNWLDGVFSSPDSLTLIQPSLRSVKSVLLGSQKVYVSSGMKANQDFQGCGCWRGKIHSGIVLECKKMEGVTPANSFPDCLVLTADALWTLFDNNLRPLANCKCTLESAENEFLSLSQKLDNWFIWHLETNRSKVCDGKSCKIDLTSTKLHRQSVCILGWPAYIRKSPDYRIAKAIPLSESFTKSVAASVTLESFQCQFTFGWQIGGATLQGGVSGTCKSNRFNISSSSPSSDDTFLMQYVAEAPILIFCEERKIHLAISGADLIEELCIQSLKDCNCDDQEIYNSEVGGKLRPRFVRITADKRLETWRLSRFRSPSGLIIAGDKLVLDACQRISRLIEATKSCSTPVYWPFGNFLTRSKCIGLKAPINVKEMGWYKLARAYPLSIVAVGSVWDMLLYRTPGVVQWHTAKPSGQWFRFKVKSSRPNIRKLPTPVGGLVATNKLIFSLLAKAAAVYPATLEDSETQLAGNPSQPSFRIICRRNDGGNKAVKCLHCETQSMLPWPQYIDCLHYFQ